MVGQLSVYLSIYHLIPYFTCVCSVSSSSFPHALCPILLSLQHSFSIHPSVHPPFLAQVFIDPQSTYLLPFYTYIHPTYLLPFYTYIHPTYPSFHFPRPRSRKATFPLSLGSRGDRTERGEGRVGKRDREGEGERKRYTERE